LFFRAKNNNRLLSCVCATQIAICYLYFLQKNTIKVQHPQIEQYASNATYIKYLYFVYLHMQDTHSQNTGSINTDAPYITEQTPEQITSLLTKSQEQTHDSSSKKYEKRGIAQANKSYSIDVHSIQTVVPTYIINESKLERSRPIWATVNEAYFQTILSQAKTADGRVYTGKGIVDFTQHGFSFIRIVRTIDSVIDTITYK
jgi:hypothetical protein